MTGKLPDHVSRYASTPVFTQDNVPAKLTGIHDTKAGVWGRLTVLEGEIDFVIPGPPQSRQIADPKTSIIITPQVKHYVVITGPVRFRVEFYK